MSARERLLLMIFVVVVSVLGVVGLLYLSFLKPYFALSKRINATQKDILTKMTEKNNEQNEINRLKSLDPRLTQWKAFSLPDSPTRDKKSFDGHVSRERVDYEKELAQLLRANNIKTVSTAASATTRTKIPTLANKTPIYTPIAYTIEARGTLKDIMKMFEEFYRQPKLHQITRFTLRKPSTAQVDVGAGALAPNAARERADPSILELNFTTEALIVNGATTPQTRAKAAERPQPGDKKAARDNDRNFVLHHGDDGVEEQEAPPSKSPTLPLDILAPGRRYSDMDRKNMFLGKPPPKKEEPKPVEQERPVEIVGPDILKHVHFNHIEQVRDRWFLPEVYRVHMYDQFLKKYQYPVIPVAEDYDQWATFEFKDIRGNTAISGTLVDVQNNSIVIKVDNRYYRMRFGDFMRNVLDPTKVDGVIVDPRYEPFTTYKRGDWKGEDTSGEPPQPPPAFENRYKLIECKNNGRRWAVVIKDLVERNEYTPNPESDVTNEVKLEDKREKKKIQFKVVDANTQGIVLEMNGMFYKMLLNETLADVLNPAKGADRAPLKEYKRGDWKVDPPPSAEKKEEKKSETK